MNRLFFCLVMDKLVEVSKYVDPKQIEFINSIRKYNVVYGLMYWLFSALMIGTGAPQFLLILQIFLGLLLIASHFLPKSLGLQLFLIALIFIEFYIYTLCTYHLYPSSLYWFLLMTNYLFFFRNKRERIAFVGLMVGLILSLPFLNAWLIPVFNFSQNSNYNEWVNIISALFLLLINYTIIQQFIDITNSDFRVIQNKNKSLALVQERLIESQRFQEQFFANINHEMRTPLSTIMGIIDLIRKEGKNTEYVECLHQSAQSLFILIDEFLEYDKINKGEIEFDRKPMNLRKSIEKLSQIFTYLFSEKNIEFSLKVCETTPNFIVADEKRLHQILLNILGNSVKNTQNSWVELSIKPKELSNSFTQIEFEIKNKLRNFKKNTTTINGLTPSYTEKIPSLLSLSLTQKIIASSEGNLDVEITAGKTNRYTLSMRFQISKKHKSREIMEDYEKEKSKKTRILIVDDNKINLIISKKQLLLQNQQLEIDTEEEGEKALILLAKNEYDIILLDIRMPKISGLEIAHHLRTEMKRNQNTPIIALTADITDATKDECTHVGIDAIVSKPFDITDLMEAIDNLNPKNV